MTSGFPQAAIREALDQPSKRCRTEAVSEVLAMFSEWKGINSNMDNVIRSALGLSSLVEVEEGHLPEASVPPLPDDCEATTPVLAPPELTAAQSTMDLSLIEEARLSAAAAIMSDNNLTLILRSCFSYWRLDARESFITRKLSRDKENAEQASRARLDKISASVGALSDGRSKGIYFTSWRRITTEERIRREIEKIKEAGSAKTERVAAALNSSNQKAYLLAAFTGWRREAFEALTEKVAAENHKALVSLSAELEKNAAAESSASARAAQALLWRSTKSLTREIFRNWRSLGNQAKIETKAETVDLQYRKILYFKMCFAADERTVRSVFRAWQELRRHETISAMKAEISQLKTPPPPPPPPTQPPQTPQPENAAIEKSEEAANVFAICLMHSRRQVKIFSNWRSMAYDERRQRRPKPAVSAVLEGVRFEEALRPPEEPAELALPETRPNASQSPGRSVINRRTARSDTPQTWVPVGVGVPEIFEMPLADAQQILSDGMWVHQPRLWGLLPCLPPNKRFLAVKNPSDFRAFLTMFTDNTCETVFSSFSEAAVSKSQFNFLLAKITLLDAERQEETIYGFTQEFLTAIAVVVADIEKLKMKRRSSTTIVT